MLVYWKILILIIHVKAALTVLSAQVYCTARQCSQNVVNHMLHHSTPYHYKLYLVYPAQHLNFARCTIHIRSYMPSCCLR